MIRTLAAALATTTCLVALSAPAAAQTRQFDIPAGSLRTALDAFARQSGRQVIYRGDEVRSAQSSGVHGARTAEEALDAILTGTGFKAQKDSSGAFAVAKVGNGSAAAEAAASMNQVVAANGEGASQDIIVTGTNIRGVAPTGSPYRAYTGAEIQARGSATVSDFLATLPQNFNSISSTTTFVGESDNPANGSGVNLHGLGSRTTLTLLDGHRLAASGLGAVTDISSIPIAAIERVDILSDGASAIYGSDAVAGVANFVLKKDYDGAETRVRIGSRAGSSSTQLVASQALGKTWQGGSGLITVNYQDTTALKAGDRSYASGVGPDFDLDPSHRSLTLLAAGRQAVTDDLELSADIYFSHGNSRSVYSVPAIDYQTRLNARINQFDANVGATYSFGRGWEATLELARAENKVAQHDLISENVDRTNAHLTDATFKLDGILFHLPAGPVRLAIGYDGRWEKTARDNPSFAAAGLVDAPLTRNVHAAFAEANIPIIASDLPLLKRLTVSIAGRYERYSDFGSTFNPKFGAQWDLSSEIALRASYGTSFSVARFADTQTSFNYGYITGLQSPGCPSTGCLVLEEGGYQSGYKPERSKSFTTGFDIKPQLLPGALLRLSYYHIDYRDRIADLPSDQFILDNISSFSTISVSRPSSQFISDTISRLSLNPQGVINTVGDYDPAGFDYYLNLRRTNLARSITSGLDVSLSYAKTLGKVSLTASVDANYIIGFRNRLTSASVWTTGINRVGLPNSFRITGSFGLAAPTYSINALVRHVGGYENDAVAPVASIHNWTTADLRAALELGRVLREKPQGLELSLTVQNILNKKPPAVGIPVFSIGYDPTNADPFGRVVSVEVVKRW